GAVPGRGQHSCSFHLPSLGGVSRDRLRIRGHRNGLHEYIRESRWGHRARRDGLRGSMVGVMEYAAVDHGCHLHFWRADRAVDQSEHRLVTKRIQKTQHELGNLFDPSYDIGSRTAYRKSSKQSNGWGE